ncbi:MAG: GH36-type glycosyl hydrolase domain-containing protein, partial [Thermodesulfobacteriota bacterium]
MSDDCKRGCGTWKFVDDKGTFEWINPPGVHQLYFPLCNEAGIMSSITPTLGGDIKTSQHTFLLLPVSIEDIHNNRSSRNFWIWSDRTGPYSLTGNSAAQNSHIFTDQDKVDLTVQGGFLWHRIRREDHNFNIKTEITSFAPVDPVTVEIMWIKITKLSEKTLELTPT